MSTATLTLAGVGPSVDASPAAKANRIAFALACIPLLDCIVDQANNILQLTIGPLSALQVFHGFLALCFAILILHSLLSDPRQIASLPLPALAAFLLLAAISTKEVVVTGRLSLVSVGAYGQMAYWLLFWLTVVTRLRAQHEREIMLGGLATGALATAFSVFLGFFLGARNYYQEDSVSSSAGWFSTAKMITGVLLTGGVVLLYLGRKRPGWLFPVAAATCFIACILTYARAGAVAMAAVMLWLVAWRLFCGRRAGVADQNRWIDRFLILALAGALALPVVMGPQKLFARWSDVGEGGQAGSGRATFWKIAADNYIDGTGAQQALGRGYSAMADMLFRDYGMDIKHTHNDLLDMLTVGGLMGAVWLLFFVTTLFWRVLQSSLSTPEGAAGMAILLAYLFHGQFTGQLWGTDAMSYYTLSLTCLLANSRAPRTVAASAIAPYLA